MSKFNYEKNNTITTLKNEIFGLKQIIETLQKIKSLDFGNLENKIINVKVEKFIKEKAGVYTSLGFSYSNDEKISFIVNDRYNKETSSYIGFYDRYTLNLGYIVDEKGKHRISSEQTFVNIQEDLTRLGKSLKELQEELKNIDAICKEYQEIYEQMKEFSKNRTSFFRDNFKQVNGFY